ncbi:MAG: Inner membrane protein YqjA [Pelotomaculum sp. PtaU1.Bin035]|nr:MAG: Inner membrane protein YqjA [Pelotomaculum sp. PtaU1.Bin035]
MLANYLFHFKELGYAGLYLSLALGVIGLPIPDEAIMTFVGYMINLGKFKLSYSLTVSFLGSISGMSLSYIIGRGILSKLADKFENKFNLKDMHIRYQKLFDKYGNVIIIAGYFFPGIRYITAYSCGLLKMNYIKFLLYSSVGAFLWVNTFILLGYYMGKDWKFILNYSIRYKDIVAIAAILLVALLSYFLQKRAEWGKNKNP